MVNTAYLTLLPSQPFVINCAFCPLDAPPLTRGGIVRASEAEHKIGFGRGSVPCGDSLRAGGGRHLHLGGWVGGGRGGLLCVAGGREVGCAR